MKKWVAVFLMMGLTVGGILGCGGNEPASTNSAGTAEETAGTQSAGSGDLSSLMQKASQTKQMSFDMVMTVDAPDGKSISSNGKMYVNDKKLRMELETTGVKMVTIVNASGEVYLYNPEGNTALKMTTPQKGAESPNAWAEKNGDTTGFTVIGEEKKDGFDCLVVTISDDSGTKMWLRKDVGLPVRVEETTSEGSVVIEYKNYDFNNQPDSLFEIPAGAQITTMPGSLPNNQ